MTEYLTSTLIDNLTRSRDQRGEILLIVDADISNVSIISCEANTIRSNHYHHLDSHFIFVLEGRINYFYKRIDNPQINFQLVEEGQSIYTPPLEIHATHFPIPTKLVVCSKNPRDQETYEKDTVRVEFINNDNLSDILKAHSSTIK